MRRSAPVLHGLTAAGPASPRRGGWLAALSAAAAVALPACAFAGDGASFPQAPGSAASASDARASAASAPSPADAANARQLLAWLRRLHEAAVRSNYVGTLVDWAGVSVTTSRVAHFADARGEVEKVEALDGEARGMLRVGDQVRTIWPARHIAVVEPRDPRASFPSLVTGGEQRIPEYYRFELLPPQRIAGHDADRVLLKARDDVRYDQMIWTDRATGLLLRVDVRGGDRTLESSAFSEVSIGVHPQPELVFDALKRTNGYRLVRTSVSRTDLAAEGWEIAGPLPPGFEALGCVRRMMPTGQPSHPESPVVQAIFTDGLTHVSVFIERYDPQRHLTAGLTVIGATHTLMRRQNDDWITVVGDVPQHTLAEFASLLQRRR